MTAALTSSFEEEKKKNSIYIIGSILVKQLVSTTQKLKEGGKNEENKAGQKLTATLAYRHPKQMLKSI